MKQIIISPDVKRKLQRLQIKDHKLSQKVRKQLKLFKENPHHPSLRLHKIKRDVKNVWSMSLDGSFRMLYVESEEDYYFFELGNHDEVYRKQ